jgi:acyl carrier protein
VGPRTATEKKLTEIWSAVLGRQQVGIHDNFFELGGHSLMAAQVMSRISRFFHIEVPVRQMFTTPSIAELSDAIVQMQIGCIPDNQFAEMLSDVETLSEDKVRHLLSLDIG